MSYCGNDAEYLFHALITCGPAMLFSDSACDFFRLKLPKLHPLTWARDLLDQSFISKTSELIMTSVMRAIWGNQNKYAHSEIGYQSMGYMQLIDELVKSLDVPPPC